MAQQKATRGERDVSAIMRKVRSGDTTPEMVFRKALWAHGVRYRVSPADMPGKPDVVVPSKKVAIFIDGDFWHGNQWRRRKRASLEDQFTRTGSREYWLTKIRRNMQRDCTVTAALMADGWTVLRFWESDIHRDVDGCVQVALDVVNGGGDPTSASLAPRKTFAEFCASRDSMRAGLEHKGWTVAFANDSDRRTRAMSQAHVPDAARRVWPGDVQAIPAISSERVPAVTLVTASFPCNDVSPAGSRHGLAGTEPSAFGGFARMLEEMGERRPPLVLLENGAGCLMSHGGKDVEEALRTLNRLNYSVDAFVLDAARFAPPSKLHSRARLFVVGVQDARPGATQVRKEQASLSSYESDIRPTPLADFILTRPDIRWAVRDLPPQPRVDATGEDMLDAVCVPVSEWIGEYYLNPVVSELMRNRVLSNH